MRRNRFVYIFVLMLCFVSGCSLFPEKQREIPDALLLLTTTPMPEADVNSVTLDEHIHTYERTESYQCWICCSLCGAPIETLRVDFVCECGDEYSEELKKTEHICLRADEMPRIRRNTDLVIKRGMVAEVVGTIFEGTPVTVVSERADGYTKIYHDGQYYHVLSEDIVTDPVEIKCLYYGIEYEQSGEEASEDGKTEK